MTLGVITATRGQSGHLAAAVASVAALGAGVGHVLVCPADAADALREKFPGCTIRPETGGGLYAALNIGLASLGDAGLFTWINDDDVLCPAGLATARALLAADPALGVVYGRVGLMDAAGARLGELPVAHRPGDLAALLAAGIVPLAQPGTLVRREVAARVGPFDPGYRLAGDLDFLVRALVAGVRFGFANAEVARFRLHAGQLSKDEAVASREHARAIARLPAGAAGLAGARFRWDNLPVYVERVRRHGFVRMSTLYRHG